MRKELSTGSGATRRAGVRSGQALVEFALVVPLVLLLLLGVVEFGRAWNAFQVITDAARSGARVSSVAAANSYASDSVTRTVQYALTRAGLTATPTITVSGFKTGTGTATTVGVVYPYRFSFLRPLAGMPVFSSVNMRSTFVMRNE